MPDVLVIGAGPTGLLLASELRLAGVETLVVDQLPARPGQSRALSLQPRSAEILHARGWLDQSRPATQAVIPAGHFAGIPLDYHTLETDFPHQLGIVQGDVEQLLEANVEVLRGHRLVELSQHDTGVTATLATPDGQRTITARYLVGADGGHSAVRKLVGDPFPGRDARVRMVVADVVLTGRSGDEWELPSQDSMGAYLVPLRGGRHRVLAAGEEQQHLPRDAEVTAGELQRAIAIHHGSGIEIEKVVWASRFGDASRQVAAYRHGRVLLAGDAAHIHLPAGGQGLNLGLEDAFNLGWKLALVVRGVMPDSLLDTYHAERHPIAQTVLVRTRAQGVLTIPDGDIAALRGFVSDLLTDPGTHHRLATWTAGLAVRYEFPGPEHPLLGTRAPNIALADGTPLADHMRGGHALLVDLTGEHAHVVAGYEDRIRYVRAAAGDEAILVRPDGYVCAVSQESDCLRASRDTWFGRL